MFRILKSVSLPGFLCTLIVPFQLAQRVDQNKILDFTLDLKSKRRGKGQKIIQQRSSKRKHKESKAELTQRIQKQLKDFAKHNPEIKAKNNPENKNDRPSY